MNLAEKKPRELSRMPAEELAKLDQIAAKQLAQAKALRALVDSALELKYADRARRSMFLRNQLTGTVHVDDGDFDVTVTFPKKVSWAPEPFRKAIDKLQRRIADWHRYVAVEYSLPEKNWSVMPEDLQKIFAEAREEGVGKVRISLARRARPADLKAA